MIERFKRVSKDVITYSATIEDPEIYTRPWTISFPLTADPDYRIFEYACHEGNYAIENILSGARALEKSSDEITEVRTAPASANDSSVVPEAMTTCCLPSSM